jgi:hypothetical protein
MLITAPVEVRWDQCDGNFDSRILISALRARRRRQRVIKRAAAAPKIAPGKKPATMALLGKEGHDSDRTADVAFVEAAADGDDIGVKVAPRVADPVNDVDVEDAVVGADSDTEAVAVVAAALFMTQVFPSQVKPNGQHFSPHLGRLSPRRVVLMGFEG